MIQPDKNPQDPAALDETAGAEYVADGTGLRSRLRRLLVSAEGRDLVLPAPPVPVRDLIRHFWPYVRPYRVQIGVGLALIVLVPITDAAKLYMIKVIVDDALTPRDVDAFAWIAPLAIGVILVSGIVRFFDTYVSSWVGERFLVALRTNLFSHLQRLSLDFFERRRLGDVVARLTEDVNAIENFILSGIAGFLTAVLTVIFFTGALFYLDWQLALIGLLVAPPFAAFTWISSRLIKRASREKRRRTGTIMAIAEESLANVALVQAYNRQEKEAVRFERETQGAFDATLVATRLKSLALPLVQLFQGLSAIAVLAFGTVALEQGRLTLGALLVFFAYLNQLFTPMRQLTMFYGLIYQASAAAERVIEFLQQSPSMTDAPGARSLARVNGAIEFDGVGFSYPDTTRAALADISFRVEPGQTVAVVGHSGAGKSTVAKLLLRFYDPTSGAIRIDGIDFRDVRIDSLRDNVAVVLQETLIFDGTVRENIVFGRTDASDEQVVAAARAADAHDFVSALPDGYDTVVGQRGRLLSGGQRQRIAIARAMIRDAPVLILDEPATGLDIESSQRVLEPLRRLMSNRTAIVIAHNLMTVRDVDSIILLEEGRLVEQGSHDELLARDAGYARLYRLHQGEPLEAAASHAAPGADVRAGS